ncbi:hypothetical protein MUK42_20669 [Musa troglodytarum]|nr:hypothetical protein MUK42_20669 [Musa troglodytarum]
MADLRATLGMRTRAEGPRSTARPGGEKAKSAQAWMQLRSKVWPEGATMTGSAMREREMGQRNSTGISAAAVVLEDGGRAEEGERRWSMEKFQNDLWLPIHSPLHPRRGLAAISLALLPCFSVPFTVLGTRSIGRTKTSGIGQLGTDGESRSTQAREREREREGFRWYFTECKLPIGKDDQEIYDFLSFSLNLKHDFN